MTSRATEPLDVFLVTHTHWDREWYHPAPRFQQRLVAVIDEVLEHGTGHPFLLDGQAVVLEDYLAVRPERAAELSQRLRDGTLEAGPWFVLADELIPSGEALVRNLLAGRRVVRRLRGMPPAVLYCPDSFGHPAVLPTLAAGFGCPVIVVWRGYGGSRWPAGDMVRWSAPDGSAALLYHLPPDGYETGSHLPPEGAAAAAHWQRLRDILGPRATLGMTLLPHGADHHAPQVAEQAAVEALERAMTPHGDRLVRSSLGRFGASLAERAATHPLPTIRGELRDSYGYAWTLQGTLGARAALKRANALAERLLLRDVEPWLALARLGGGDGRRDLLQTAWRTLLLCHPHDTLCGCAIDTVARAMAQRLDEVTAAAAGLREDALDTLVGHDPVVARQRADAWHPVVVIRNPAARPRAGVAELELDVVLAEVRVGPGSAGQSQVEVPAPDSLTLHGASALQELERHRVFVREESPRHYPRTRLVERRRVLAWIDDVPAYGLRLLPVESRPARARRGRGARAVRGGIANETLRVTVESGSLVLQANERTIRDWLTIEAEGERGDLYTHSTMPAGTPPADDPGDLTPVTDWPAPASPWRARIKRTRVVARGPLRAVLAVDWVLVIPAMRFTTATGEDVQQPAASVSLRTNIQLDRDASFVRVAIDGDNQARNIRLRVRLASDVPNAVVVADAAFGLVERRPLTVPPAEAVVEEPPRTAPLHRYVSLFDAERGCTVVSDGLAEYEAAADGSVAITLLRATGELSRPDLPERPGNAGYPAETPDAQSLGPFTANLAVLLHGPRTPEVIDAVERAADDALLPLVGHTWRTAITPPARVEGIELLGVGLACSTIKESEDGEWVVLRCVNLLDHTVAGAWRVPNAREARLARLDETPLGVLEARDGVVAFEAPPRGIVTLLVRPGL